MRHLMLQLLILCFLIFSCSKIKESENQLILNNHYSIIHIDKDYLQEDEILQLGNVIEEGIQLLLNKVKDTPISTNFPLKVFISSETGRSFRQLSGNIITLYDVKNDKSVIIHELTHAIFGGHKYSWLVEGIAVYMQSYAKFDKEKIPLYDENDNLCSYALTLNNEEINNALNKVGGKRNLETSTGIISSKEVNYFYLFSGSFVKYLINNIGEQEFLRIYKSLNSNEKIYLLSEKSFEQWKLDWLSYLSMNKIVKKI